MQNDGSLQILDKGSELPHCERELVGSIDNLTFPCVHLNSTKQLSERFLWPAILTRYHTSPTVASI
jgi:hypothetical protein